MFTWTSAESPDPPPSRDEALRLSSCKENSLEEFSALLEFFLKTGFETHFCSFPD